jgi:hypothetical protein
VQDSPESALEKYEIAKSMLTECKQSAPLEDLDRAILLFREALLQCPNSYPMRPYALNNLVMGLLTRFDHLGRTEDIDEAISLANECGAVRPGVSGDGIENARANVSVRLLSLGGGNANRGDLRWTTSRVTMIAI